MCVFKMLQDYKVVRRAGRPARGAAAILTQIRQSHGKSSHVKLSVVYVESSQVKSSQVMYRLDFTLC